MTETTANNESTLTFLLDEESGRLTARLQPCEDMLLSSVEELTEALRQTPYADFFILTEALQELANLQGKTTDKIERVVAERRDAELSIETSDDLMQAYLTITPAYGGEAVSKQHIQLALRKASLVEGLKSAVLTACLQNQPVEKVLIAEGTPATDGEDARLENLLPVVKGRQPKINKDGTVNLRELGQFVVVKPGDALMRKIPLTYGSSGTNVRGQSIPPRQGQDVLLNALSGTRISPDDENLLVARIAGQPLSYDDGIEVDPTLNVSNVDLKTGNIDFDGTVYVSGNVIAGMNIKTTGDIYIEGTVEAAILEAGGDITIKQGFIGRGNVRDDNNELNENIARAVCGGTFAAKFIGNVVVKAGRELLIDDLVSHSEVSAGDNIVVGTGEGRGCVWGGVSEAGQLFRAHSVGSSASVKTVVRVGKVSGMKMRFLEMEQELKQKQKDKGDLLALAKQMQAKNAVANKAIIENVKKTLAMNGKEQDELVKNKNEMIALYKSRLNARVVVDKEIYNGVHIYIAMAEYVVTDRRSSCTYLLENEHIVVR